MSVQDALKFKYATFIEYDGPSTVSVLGNDYFPLQSDEKKTGPAAFADYYTRLLGLLEGRDNAEIVWRLRPELERTPNGFVVYSRLFVYPAV